MKIKSLITVVITNNALTSGASDVRVIALILVVTLFVLTSCIRLQREHRLGALASPPPPEVCAKLASRALWMSLSAIGAGGVGSASTAISGDITDTAPHWSLVGIGAGMSILGGVFGYLGTYWAAQYNRKGCQ